MNNISINNSIDEKVVAGRVLDMDDSLDVRDTEAKPTAPRSVRLVKLFKFAGALVCLGIGIVSCKSASKQEGLNDAHNIEHELPQL